MIVVVANLFLRRCVLAPFISFASFAKRLIMWIDLSRKKKHDQRNATTNRKLGNEKKERRGIRREGRVNEIPR